MKSTYNDYYSDNAAAAAENVTTTVTTDNDGSYQRGASYIVILNGVKHTHLFNGPILQSQIRDCEALVDSFSNNS